jgi:hypothetical protein
MSVYISQIDLARGIAKILAKQFGVTDVLPRQFNAIIEAANRIIAEFQRDYTPAAPGCGLKAWLASDDTGMSSKWMARQMFAASPDCDYGQRPFLSFHAYPVLQTWPGRRKRRASPVPRDQYNHHLKGRKLGR